MLILQKNRFNRKDKAVNLGFALSLGLIALLFGFLPLLFVALNITNLSPVIAVLLPALITIPVFLVAMNNISRNGKILSRLKLKNWRAVYIPISLSMAFVLLIVMGQVIYWYHKLLSSLNIKATPPIIEAILKNADGMTLYCLFFGIIVLVPISEEIIFRRFIFAFLAPRCGFMLALLISSGAFAIIHFSLYSLPALFLLGIAFQLIYLKFGSLYPAILMHAFNNAIALTVLLYLPKMSG